MLRGLCIVVHVLQCVLVCIVLMEVILCCVVCGGAGVCMMVHVLHCGCWCHDGTCVTVCMFVS